MDQRFLLWDGKDVLTLVRTSSPAFLMLRLGAHVHSKSIAREAWMHKTDTDISVSDLGEILGIPVIEGHLENVNETNNMANDQYVLKTPYKRL